MSALDEVLDRLEFRISRIVPEMKRLAEENAQLKKTIEGLQEELEGLRKQESIRHREIERLMQKRKEILTRINRIRERILSLEEPLKGTTE